MATDKRLDQVSTLTDFDYALIVKGDQVAKASKQQLAELVGNLLYGATNASSLATVVAGKIGSGIMDKGDTTANCDSLGVGIYRITQIDGYIDLNYPAFNGYVISLVASGKGSQIFYFGDDPVVYYRHKWNIWTPWKKISFNP